MSRPKYVLEISSEAYDDLVEIQKYTFIQYGELQWKKYEELLEGGLEHIQTFPKSGVSRNDIPDKYLSWPVGEHLMIYRIEGNIVFLIRVLHQKMNFLKWL